MEDRFQFGRGVRAKRASPSHEDSPDTLAQAALQNKRPKHECMLPRGHKLALKRKVQQQDTARE
eukprot:541930-Pelagomonas_calceolata.AAC.1